MRRPLALCALAVLLAACGGGGADPAPPAAAPAAATTAAAPTGTVVQAGVELDVLPEAAALPAPTDGGAATGVGGWSMTTAPDWAPAGDGVAAGAGADAVWFVGPAVGGFSPNVNLIVQDVPAGLDLAAYWRLSLANASALVPGFALREAERIALPSGPGVRLVYDGQGEDGTPLRFLAIWTVADGRAIPLTLTAPVAAFPALAAGAEPYLRTLRAPVTG